VQTRRLGRLASTAKSEDSKMRARYHHILISALTACSVSVESSVTRPSDAIQGMIPSSGPIKSCEADAIAVNSDQQNFHDGYEPDESYHLPWNPSPNIDPQGYLRSLYRRIPGSWESSSSDTNFHIRHKSNDSNPTSSCPYSYSRDLWHSPVIVRQVPGDGNCLFHSIAVSLIYAETGKQFSMDNASSLRELKRISHNLRIRAVECLNLWSCEFFDGDHQHHRHRQRSRSRNRGKRKFKRLFIQGKETILTEQLVEAAASQYGITGLEYCELMAKDAYWGGGPEIVALCNVLKRPIHVYELVDARSIGVEAEETLRVEGTPCETVMGDNLSCVHCGGGSTAIQHDLLYDQRTTVPTHSRQTRQKPAINRVFYLRRMAAFGSPKFDDKEPLNILSADSRFPDLDPRHALGNGNHFLAMFPVSVNNYPEWVHGSCADNRGFLCTCVSNPKSRMTFSTKESPTQRNKICNVHRSELKKFVRLNRVVRFVGAFIKETLKTY